MATPRRDMTIELPIGFTDETGRIHRRATIRKMRGHEEALMYDTTLSTARLITKLIHSCLIRLGDLELKDESIVASLYTADRNYLLVEMRRFTLGDTLHTSYLCPGCGQTVSAMENLGNLPVRRLEAQEQLSDIDVQLVDGYEDREGNTHKALVLTLPKGSDEEFIFGAAAEDPMRAQDALLLRCIRRFGTLPKATLEAYGVKILRDLTMGDRQILQRALGAEMPGVDFVRTIQCERCGSTFQAALDTSVFFSSN
jgi:hypothetical protein